MTNIIKEHCWLSRFSLYYYSSIFALNTVELRWRQHAASTVSAPECSISQCSTSPSMDCLCSTFCAIRNHTLRKRSMDCPAKHGSARSTLCARQSTHCHDPRQRFVQIIKFYQNFEIIPDSFPSSIPHTRRELPCIRYNCTVNPRCLSSRLTLGLSNHIAGQEV